MRPAASCTSLAESTETLEAPTSSSRAKFFQDEDVVEVNSNSPQSVQQSEGEEFSQISQSSGAVKGKLESTGRSTASTTPCRYSTSEFDDTECNDERKLSKDDELKKVEEAIEEKAPSTLPQCNGFTDFVKKEPKKEEEDGEMELFDEEECKSKTSKVDDGSYEREDVKKTDKEMKRTKEMAELVIREFEIIANFTRFERWPNFYFLPSLQVNKAVEYEVESHHDFQTVVHDLETFQTLQKDITSRLTNAQDLLKDLTKAVKELPSKKTDDDADEKSTAPHSSLRSIIERFAAELGDGVLARIKADPNLLSALESPIVKEEEMVTEEENKKSNISRKRQKPGLMVSVC